MCTYMTLEIFPNPHVRILSILARSFLYTYYVNNPLGPF